MLSLHSQLRWMKVGKGSYKGISYSIYEAKFKSPSPRQIYDALPPESRVSRVRMVAPDNAPSGCLEPTSLIQLPATGEHQFFRRVWCALQLLPQGITSYILESPYYGARRPPAQHRSKLHHVSDLFLLGTSTINETLALLHTLKHTGPPNQALCGISMGGLHACMIASLYPHPVAVTTLLAPRSGSYTYCQGGFAPAVDWRGLLADWRARGRDITEVLTRMADVGRPTGVLHVARTRREWERLGGQFREGVRAENEYVGVAAAQIGQQQQDGQSELSQQFGQKHMLQQEEKYIKLQQQQQCMSLQQQKWSLSEKEKHSYGNRPADYAIFQYLQQQNNSQDSWRDAFLQSLERLQAQPVASPDALPIDEAIFSKFILALVLDTFTDILRLPPPVRADTAIFLGSPFDAYVDARQMEEIKQHWQGGQSRLISGGHISAQLFSIQAYYDAIVESIDILQQGDSRSQGIQIIKEQTVG